MAAPLPHRPLVGLPELGELELATDQRHLEVAEQRLRVGQYLHQPERSHRLRLALQRERLDGVRSHGVGDDPVRGLSDQYLARLRRRPATWQQH